MSGTKKIRKTATMLLAIVGVMFLWFVIRHIASIATNIEHGSILQTEQSFRWSVFTVFNYAFSATIVLLSFAIGASLLFSIRKDETPFNCKNVKKLKAIAILLVVFEPYHFLAGLFINRFFPIVLGDGTSIAISISLGGAILVTGFIVYCIALVFEYGISLQNQVDETL